VLGQDRLVAAADGFGQGLTTASIAVSPFDRL